jgi:hypothetical protein
LAVQGSQTRLRARVRELLREAERAEVSPGAMSAVVMKVDEMLEVDPSDARHMFWEEMKRLFYAMREIELEDLDGETMDDFLKAMDGVSNVLFRVGRRSQERHKREASDSKLFNLQFPDSLLRGRRIENVGFQRERCSLWSRAGFNTPPAKSACGATERRRRNLSKL